MRIRLGIITATVGSSAAVPVTPFMLGVFPFQDTMRIALGSIAATSGTSTTTASTIGMFPILMRITLEVITVTLGTLTTTPSVLVLFPFSYPSLNYLWKTNKECLKQYILPNLS